MVCCCDRRWWTSTSASIRSLCLMRPTRGPSTLTFSSAFSRKSHKNAKISCSLSPLLRYKPGNSRVTSSTAKSSASRAGPTTLKSFTQKNLKLTISMLLSCALCRSTSMSHPETSCSSSPVRKKSTLPARSSMKGYVDSATRSLS